MMRAVRTSTPVKEGTGVSTTQPDCDACRDDSESNNDVHTLNSELSSHSTPKDDHPKSLPTYIKTNLQPSEDSCT